MLTKSDNSGELTKVVSGKWNHESVGRVKLVFYSSLVNLFNRPPLELINQVFESKKVSWCGKIQASKEKELWENP